MTAFAKLPPELEPIRAAARQALKDVNPAGSPQSEGEDWGLMLSSRTDGGRSLPAYYLVYFLLVDLLEYPDLGRWEKVAWVVPVRYQGRLYSIDHAKFGVGVFAPNLDPKATRSTKPSDQAEADAREIAAAINKAVSIATPYFEWRASEAASSSKLNVVNAAAELFGRYEFFRDQFRTLSAEAVRRKDERIITKSHPASGHEVTTTQVPAYSIVREAKWSAQAAIDAFFSWTEHVFIHLAIFQGKATTGTEVAALAGADWKVKFKAALGVLDPKTKQYYDSLLELRSQLRNFMAHGAFGKRGEAFSFHSGAGAVPVQLTSTKKRPYALTGTPAFEEGAAIVEIEGFIEHLWSGPLAPAKLYVLSELPTILTYAIDGTYERGMQSEEDMTDLVDRLTYQADMSVNMDW